MSYRQAFLQDILDHPDDDVPRLVFADWLDEHGEAARAEFIRVQVRLAALPVAAGWRLELQRRQQELLDEHQARWLEPLRGLVHNARFRRGFVEHARLDAETFLDHGDEVFAREPIRSLAFLERPPGILTQVAGSPHLGRLHALDLRYQNRVELVLAARRVSAAEMLALAAAPALAGLKTLNLGWCPLDAEAVGTLAWSPHLTGLEHLLLDQARLGDRGVEVFAGSPRPRRLETLDLSHNNIGPAGARALAAAPGLASLTTLLLSWNELGDEGAAALAGSSHLRRLTLLALQGHSLGDAGAEALAASPHLGGLRRLEFHGNPLSHQGRGLLLARFGKRVCRW